MENGLISIIIVNYFRIRLTEFCINSIIETIPRSKYKLIVIDNNSPDNSAIVFSEYKKKGIINDLILNKSNGFESRGLNQGMKIINDKYPDSEFVLWMLQDFFCMKGWYENFIIAARDLNIDFVSSCYLERSSNDKVAHSPTKITSNGGAYGELVARGKWEYDVGAGLIFDFRKMRDFFFDENYDPEKFWEKGNCGNPQMETYRIMCMEKKLKGVRLHKPALLMQDPEYNNPEYLPYYKFWFNSKGQRMGKWLRFFIQNGYVHDLEEYYKGTDYKPSKFIPVGKETIVDWGLNPGDIPDHGWR